jgi:hypothetical protein
MYWLLSIFSFLFDICAAQVDLRVVQARSMLCQLSTSWRQKEELLSVCDVWRVTYDVWPATLFISHCISLLSGAMLPVGGKAAAAKAELQLKPDAPQSSP